MIRTKTCFDTGTRCLLQNVKLLLLGEGGGGGIAHPLHPSKSVFVHAQSTSSCLQRVMDGLPGLLALGAIYCVETG